MPEIHHRYGGSTINRTLNCAVWRKLSDDMPQSPSSKAADTGTLCHNCMEEYYDKGVDFDTMLKEGRSYEGIKLTQALITEKLEPAQLATEQILDKYEVETVSLEPFVELIEGLAGGSIDLLAISGDQKTIIILDYKFGYYQVNPETPQLPFYALAAWADPATSSMFNTAEKIACVIVQPDNVDYLSTTAKVKEYTIDELDQFEDAVFEAINKAEAVSGNMAEQANAGEWCKFCPAEAFCPAKTNLAFQPQKPIAIDEGRITTEQVEQLNEALPIAEKLEAWIKSVRKLAHEQLERGVELKDYKIVDKRASRVWSNTDDVEALAAKIKKIKKADSHAMTLKSPAQMEKVCKDLNVDFKRFLPCISHVSSGTTLVKASDKRQSAVPSLALKRLADRL